jgi:hypothetical protein
MTKGNSPFSQTPASGQSVQVRDRESFEEERDRIQEADAARKLAGKASDKVAAIFATKFWTTDMTWGWFVYEGRHLRVTHFYEKAEGGPVAVDKFVRMGDYNRCPVAAKKRLLNENGIRYIALNPNLSLADIAPELESQKVSGS